MKLKLKEIEKPEGEFCGFVMEDKNGKNIYVKVTENEIDWNAVENVLGPLKMADRAFFKALLPVVLQQKPKYLVTKDM